MKAWDIMLRFATLVVQAGRRPADNEVRETFMSKKCAYGTSNVSYCCSAFLVDSPRLR